jgi:hypothetical protein
MNANRKEFLFPFREASPKAFGVAAASRFEPGTGEKRCEDAQQSKSTSRHGGQAVRNPSLIRVDDWRD